MTNRPDLAVLVASLYDGGVGKMRVRLMNEIVRRGYTVDLVTARSDSPYMKQLSPAIRVVPIGTTHALTGVPALARYLWSTRPRVMLSQRTRVNVLALRARTLARSGTRMFLTVNVNLTSKLDAVGGRKREKGLAQLRKYFPRNDGIIAVSRGVADDVARLLGWPPERIRVAPNPTVTPAIYEAAKMPLDHPWFTSGEVPVFLGVGRLVPEKDFANLLHAFAKVRATRHCRLVILGEGPERPKLLALSAKLGLADDAQLPGFVDNPYAYMARASVFVLSSTREGLPNALTEALAVGVPVVSTDCPNGPYEILEAGRHGPLVPVGDSEALAAAMTATLEHPTERAARQAAAQRYTVERSASVYLEAMGFAAAGAAT
ncbi:glycosyltransferase [Sulfurifustis variabilis]|nr:glycosyltransferase [Sulfurifustis variabilis]